MSSLRLIWNLCGNSTIIIHANPLSSELYTVTFRNAGGNVAFRTIFYYSHPPACRCLLASIILFSLVAYYRSFICIYGAVKDATGGAFARNQLYPPLKTGHCHSRFHYNVSCSLASTRYPISIAKSGCYPSETLAAG